MEYGASILKENEEMSFAEGYVNAIRKLDARAQVKATKPPKPKLLIIGHARHGKDTVCQILSDDYGFSFISSSLFCAEHIVRPWLEDKGIFYPSVGVCYNDRHNHREAWHQAIRAYNHPELSRLGRAIWAENDIYCGLRSCSEWSALKNEKCYDTAIWIDRSYILEPEDKRSNQMEPWMADYVLDNNGTLIDLKHNLNRLMAGRIL